MEWWRDLFTTPLWQDVQLSWEEADDADADASLVVDALGLRPGSRVLDAPCGTGRIAKRLRARGHDVVGLDATERFLVEAAAVGVPVVRADMRTSPLRRASFDAAFCLWGSFGYFDDEGNRAQARALADRAAAGRTLPRRHDRGRHAAAEVRAARHLGGRRDPGRRGPRVRRGIEADRDDLDLHAGSRASDPGDVGPPLHGRRAHRGVRRRGVRVLPGAGRQRYCRSARARSASGSSRRCPAKPPGRAAGTPTPRPR